MWKWILLFRSDRFDLYVLFFWHFVGVELLGVRGMLPKENMNFRPNIRNAGFWQSGRLFALGSESNDDSNGDGNENSKKAIGLISKTTTLHVHHACLYITLPSLHHYDVIMPNFTFYGERKQATMNFSFSFLTWVRSLRNQLQGNSPTFHFFCEFE